MQTTLAKSLRNKSSETTSKGLERAGEILDAARAVFAGEGYAKLSMRGVAARVGITLGTVQHYYPTKEALFEAMLLRTLEELQASADRMAQAEAGASPAAQFRDAMRYFIRELGSEVNLATFTELKALSMREPFAAGVMEQVFTRARMSVGRRVRALVPAVSHKELNLRSALIVAQLMGLTWYDFGASRRRRADLAGLEDAAVEAMVALALGR